MRQVRITLGAAIASAMVVVAVTALDAVGAGKVFATDPGVAIANCLRDHGVAVPNLQGKELARWFKTNHPPEDTVRACKMAMAPKGTVVVEKEPATAADVAKLTECLRSHGLNPPADPAQLKRWIITHEEDAASALKACDFGQPPAQCGEKAAVPQTSAPAPAGTSDGF